MLAGGLARTRTQLSKQTGACLCFSRRKSKGSTRLSALVGPGRQESSEPFSFAFALKSVIRQSARKKGQSRHREGGRQTARRVGVPCSVFGFVFQGKRPRILGDATSQSNSRSWRRRNHLTYWICRIPGRLTSTAQAPGPVP